MFTPYCCSWPLLCWQLQFDLAKNPADTAAGSSELLRVPLPSASEHATHLFVRTLYTKRVALRAARLFDSLSGSWLQEPADLVHCLDCADMLEEVDAAMQRKVGVIKQAGMASTSNTLAVLTWAEQCQLPGLQYAAAEDAAC